MITKIKTLGEGTAFPKEWDDEFNFNELDQMNFRNVAHWKHHLKSITPTNHKSSDKGLGYDYALKALLKGESLIDEGKYETIKNAVKNVLVKKGLISENVYEEYKYHHEGTIIDMAKVAELDPNCFLQPVVTYQNYFYELYISMSIPYYISDEEVSESLAKIMATVELLESEHIYTKLTMVLPINNVAPEKQLMITLPLFSHKDTKDIKKMSSVLNVDTLRKFYFCIAENKYGKDLHTLYGYVKTLPRTIAAYNVDEEELASEILNATITPGSR